MAYVESPLDRIVNVHWGSAAQVVVAEVPHEFAYLLSLDPADPADGIIGDEQLISSGTYDPDIIIPSEDYTSKVVNTTANIYAGLPTIDGIADTSTLTTNQNYPISGDGISAGTSMTYTGGSAGTLSSNGLFDIAGSAVAIRVPIWRYQVFVGNVHFADGTIGAIYSAEFWVELELGDQTYVRSPYLLYQSAPLSGLSDAEKAADVDAHYADLITNQGYKDYQLYRYYRSGLPDAIHNGVNVGPWPFSIWQFWQIFHHPSDVFLINMSYTHLVQIMQLVYDESYYGSTTAFLPGYLATGGTKLTAYPPGTEFSLNTEVTNTGFGPHYGLIVKARSGTTTDPGTGLPADIPAVPAWTARIPPMDHPPLAPIEIARFDASGLV